MESTRRVTIFSPFGLLWLCVCLATCLIGLVIYGSLEFYPYQFPVVINWGWIIALLVAHGIPVLLIGLAVFFLIKKRRNKAIIMLIIVIPALILCFLMGVGYGLYKQPLVSFTADPNNFGSYDTKIQETLRLMPPAFYPDAIPEDAQNVRYCYYYKNDSAEVLYIAVSWKADPQYLEQSATQIAQTMTAEKTDSQVLYRSDYQIDINVSKYTKNIVIIDYSTNEICCVITNWASLLPKNINEAFDVAQNYQEVNVYITKPF